MAETRGVFQVTLSLSEAEAIAEVVDGLIDDNTAYLKGQTGWIPSDNDRAKIKVEQAALRRVRDALRRQIPKEA